MIGGGSLVLAGMIIIDLFWRHQNDWSRWATDFFTAWLSNPTCHVHGLAAPVGGRAASRGFDRLGTRAGNLGCSLDEPARARRDRAGQTCGQPSCPALDGGGDWCWRGRSARSSARSVRVRTSNWITATALAATLMAAVGVRCSLSLPTATKSMTWTIALWIAAAAVVAFLALAIIAMVCLFFITVWMVEVQYGFVMINSPPWFPMRFGTAWPLITDLVMVLLTSLDRPRDRACGLTDSPAAWPAALSRPRSTSGCGATRISRSFCPTQPGSRRKSPEELSEIVPEIGRPVDVVAAD